MKKYLLLLLVAWFALPGESLGQTEEFSWVYVYFNKVSFVPRPIFTVLFNDKAAFELKWKDRIKCKVRSTGDIRVSCFYSQRDEKRQEGSVPLSVEHGKSYYVRLDDLHLKLSAVDEITGKREFSNPRLAKVQDFEEDMRDPFVKKGQAGAALPGMSPADRVKKSAKPNQMTLSVMDLNVTSGLALGEVTILTDRLLNELVTHGSYKVVERSKRDEILKEQGFQQSGVCDQGTCLVEAGQLLGVQKMVGGTIGKLGLLYAVELRVMDVGTGEIDMAFSRQYGGDVSALLGAMTEAAAVLSGAK